MAKVSDMISGLGMATNLLRALLQAIELRGGQEAMLHFLTTEDGKENLGNIADLLVSLPWRVPMSVIKQLAYHISVQDDGTAFAESDRECFWQPALHKLNIPYLSFRDPAEYGDCGDGLPTVLRDQLEGKTIIPGMPVRWRDEEYVLAGISFASDGHPLPGDVIHLGNCLFVILAPAAYIDTSR